MAPIPWAHTRYLDIPAPSILNNPGYTDVFDCFYRIPSYPESYDLRFHTNLGAVLEGGGQGLAPVLSMPLSDVDPVEGIVNVPNTMGGMTRISHPTLIFPLLTSLSSLTQLHHIAIEDLFLSPASTVLPILDIVSESMVYNLSLPTDVTSTQVQTSPSGTGFFKIHLGQHLYTGFRFNFTWTDGDPDPAREMTCIISANGGVRYMSQSNMGTTSVLGGCTRISPSTIVAYLDMDAPPMDVYLYLVYGPSPTDTRHFSSPFTRAIGHAAITTVPPKFVLEVPTTSSWTFPYNPASRLVHFRVMNVNGVVC